MPRDINHLYGHGKAEFLSAAIEGTLITSAGAIIIYKAVKSFIEPVELQKLDYGIYLVAAAAIINYIVGLITERKGENSNSLALTASGKNLKSDSYSTFGIIVGLVLSYFTGLKWIDPIVAVIFGVIIIYTGYKILRRSIAGIMDEADVELLKKIVDLLNKNKRENWVDLHNLRVIKYGSILHIDCHLTVPWYLNVNEAHEEIDALAKTVKKEFGETLEMFAHSDGCMYFQCPICDKKNCPVRQHTFVKEIRWTVENILKDKKHRYEDL